MLTVNILGGREYISFISFGNFKCVQFVETELECAVNSNIKKKKKKIKKKQKQKQKKK